MLLIGILVLGVTAFFNYRVARTLAYPPALFATYWTVLLGLLLLAGDAFYDLSHTTILIFCLAVLAFSAGGAAAQQALAGIPAPFAPPSPARVRTLLLGGLAFLVLFAPVFAVFLARLSADSGDTEFFRGIRYKTSVESEDGFGLYAYGVSLSLLVALAYVAYAHRLPRFKWWGALILLTALVIQAATMARTTVLTLLFAIIGIAWVKGGRLNVKTAALAGGAATVLFLLVAVVLQKGGSADDSLADNIASLARMVRLYLLAAFVAFDQYVEGHVFLIETPRTLRFVYRLLISLGFDLENPPIVEWYVNTPEPTNVYTFLLPYYADFGFGGVIVFMALLGYAVTWAFVRARQGSPRAMVAYGYAFAALLLSNAQDHFFTATSRWIQLFIVVAVVFSSRQKKVSLAARSLSAAFGRTLASRPQG